MITTEELRAERGASNVTYLELIKLSNREPGSLLCTVEGKDSPYYEPRIRQWAVHRAFDGAVRLLNASGKRAVLQVRDAVQRNPALSSVRAIFIVDRDFDTDREFASENTYVTDGYSVEFFYFGRNFVERVFESCIFNQKVYGETRDKLSAILDIYVDLEQKYLDNAFEFNAWTLAQRRLNKKRVSLGHIDKTRYFEICAVHRISKFDVPRETLESLDDERNNLPSDEQLDEARKILSAVDKAVFFRAKQHALFVISFLESTLSAIRNKEDNFVFDEFNIIQLSIKNFIDTFSSYAETARSLLDFLDLYYSRKIAA